MEFRKIFLRFLGLYQILGGMFGFYKFLATYLDQSLLQWIQGILFVVPLIIIPILTGYYLLFTNQIKKGLKWTFINQILQFVQFKFFGAGLYYISGMYYNFGIVKDNFGWHLSSEGRIFDYECVVKLYSNDTNILFLVNIVPFLVISILTFGKFYKTAQNN